MDKYVTRCPYCGQPTPNETAHSDPPVVEGGQGRTDEELTDNARALWIAGIALAVGLGVALLYWLFF